MMTVMLYQNSTWGDSHTSGVGCGIKMNKGRMVCKKKAKCKKKNKNINGDSQRAKVSF